MSAQTDQLAELAEAIQNNNICPELAAQATNLVMGDGNPNADIVFIGEAPGKNEDELGLPFVGAAGKFLNEMLAAANMDRSDVYITNIVKYRPPNNRDPSPAEKKAFWPYLLKQLQIIEPKVVITLGRHSMEYFLPDMKIGQIHGQAKRIQFGDHKIVIVPLYHPAAALYNGSLRQTLIDDFLAVPEIIKKLKAGMTKIQTTDTNLPYSYPETRIIEVINGLPKNVRDSYPDHIFEPQRIEIARELVLKEYFKLFPFLTSDQFQQMDLAMIDWFDGRDQEMAPVHDYWNFLDNNLIGLKLKDIVPVLTSENVVWQQEQLDPKGLSLYWPVGTLGVYEDKWNFDYDFIKTNVIDDSESFKENKRISDEKSGDTVVNRDEYPIIVTRDISGKLKLVDGNRRTMRAWLYGDSSINAWVGTLKAEPMLSNYWVPTGQLRRLIAEYSHDPRPEIKQSVRSQLKILFEISSIAKYHYQVRCLNEPYARELVDGIKGEVH